MELKKVVIKRSGWARGFRCMGYFTEENHGKGNCCLGFDLEQTGAEIGKDPLSGFKGGGPAWKEQWEYSAASGGGHYEAVGVNDDPNITDEVREERLKEIFLRAGRLLEFVD